MRLGPMVKSVAPPAKGPCWPPGAAQTAPTASELGSAPGYDTPTTWLVPKLLPSADTTTTPSDASTVSSSLMPYSCWAVSQFRPSPSDRLTVVILYFAALAM